MSKNNCGAVFDIVLASIFLCFLWVLYGAIPFIGMPTLGHALWSSSFAQSFANNGILDLYANNIGVPAAAAMAFGLAGAWVQGLFIRLGVFPADAYSLMYAFWITIAYMAAYKLALKYCTSRALSIIAAAAWVAMPIGWGHTGYSMLALGVLLLPLYFLSAVMLHEQARKSLPELLPSIVFHMACCIVAVFMDGYTFMMFAVGCFSLTGIRVILDNKIRLYLLKKCLPIHIASFACAYALYTQYVGTSYSDGNYNELFIFSGLNIFSLFVPQQGVSWFFEALQVGVKNGGIRMTAFSAPLLLLVVYVVLRLRGQVDGLSRSVLCVSFIGLYLSFGPHLQFPRLSQLDFAALNESLTTFSFKQFYLTPTGTGFIYKYVPGFNSMRVTFRWVALAIFMWWFFIVLNLKQLAHDRAKVGVFLLLSIVLYTPNLIAWLEYSVKQRNLFLKIESSFVLPLAELISPDEVVAFIPWGNDMVVPYAASRGGYITLNIAGDKNILQAKQSWPGNFASLGDLLFKSVAPTDVPRVADILLSGEADVAVIPSAIKFLELDELPCTIMDKKIAATIKARLRETGFYCPGQMLNYDPAVIAAIKSDGRLSFYEHENFTIIRLRAE